mgnify:CR=1 FL=1
MKYLIFDFDGVLADTYGPRMEVLLERGDRSKEEILAHTDQYFTKSDHTRDLNLSKEAVLERQERVVKFGKLLQAKGFDLFWEFIEELKKFNDVKMAVVSSGATIYIKPKLENCGVEFSHILSFEDHHSKESKVETICKDWGISVTDAYFFTDTISDVKELENIMDKNNIYGCAWGYQGKEKLATVLDQEHILENFSDIQKVFKTSNHKL